MESAFGIDHGYSEIDKALPGMGALSSLGTKMAGAATGAGNKLRRAGAGNIRSSKSLALAPGASKGRAAAGGMKMRAGGALKKLGQGMAAKPGLTGGLAAGGAGAGALGGAGLMANRRTY